MKIPLFLSFLLLIAGCDDEIHVNNPIIKKGQIIDKLYITKKYFPVCHLISSDNNNLQIQEFIPEKYFIVIENVVDNPRWSNKIRNRTVYEINSSLFSELEIWTIFDVSNNPNAKVVEAW